MHFILSSDSICLVGREHVQTEWQDKVSCPECSSDQPPDCLLHPFSHHQLDFNFLRRQHQCTTTSTRKPDVGCIQQDDAWLLQDAVASSPDSLLWGHQGNSGCSLLLHHASMPKFVERRFEDPKNAEPTPEDCTTLPTPWLDLRVAAAPTAVATEAPPPWDLPRPGDLPGGGASSCCCWTGPQPSRKGRGMGPEE